MILLTLEKNSAVAAFPCPEVADSTFPGAFNGNRLWSISSD